MAADGSVASMGFNHDGDYIVIAAGADNSTVLRGVYSSWECVEGKPGELAPPNEVQWPGDVRCMLVPATPHRLAVQACVLDWRHVSLSPLHATPHHHLEHACALNAALPAPPLAAGYYTALLTQTTTDEDGNGEPDSMAAPACLPARCFNCSFWATARLAKRFSFYRLPGRAHLHLSYRLACSPATALPVLLCYAVLKEETLCEYGVSDSKGNR